MKHSTLSLLICIGGCFSACSPTNEKVNPLTQHEDEITTVSYTHLRAHET